MAFYRLVFVSFIPILFISCASSIKDDSMPAASLYCGGFLIYDMCTQDIDHDGVVEFVYFQDSNEVFLYREGVEAQRPPQLAMHECAQVMDERLVNNASKTFYITEDTSLLEITDIKGALLVSYISYLPAVTACNAELE